jgi:hypothetical protein
MKKSRVIIRMGAGRWTADVRHGKTVLHFDLNKMDKAEQKQFRVELTRAWRVATQ